MTKADAPIGARRGLLALSPVILFLMLYLVVSAVGGDFYAVPIAVALVVAGAFSLIIAGGRPLVKRIEIFSRAAADPDILYMVWIFILAGAFASLARGTGAVDAAVALTLNAFPPDYLVAALFMAACFISLSIGTSVGTVVALTPLAVEMAEAGGASVALFTAAVLGGAFFGDNLSFISDTTIAATRTQGCNMADKFRANIWLAVPAAIVTLGIYLIIGHGVITPDAIKVPDADWVLVVPYLLVIALAVAGINVTIVLSAGILAALATGLWQGMAVTELLGFSGSGIDSMGQLVIVTLLAAGMLGVVRALGGIRWLLQVLTARVSGLRGAQASIAMLVGAACLCTANNTVAIITVGSMSRDIARRYGVDPRKSASLLDTASCIVQCLIPYGAQTLLATTLAGISPAAPWPYLYYPWALSVIVALSIVFLFPRRLHPQGV